MRAAIFDLPSIGVTDGHVEKVDRYNQEAPVLILSLRVLIYTTHWTAPGG
jgi:hypothetical protein